MTTSYQKPDRGPKWHQGVDGIFETEKHFEDVDVDTQNWEDKLHGETITSSTWATDGISLISSSNTTTTTTCTVTGIGSAHVDIATSGGRTFRVYFRWRRLHRPIFDGLGGGSLPGEYR